MKKLKKAVNKVYDDYVLLSTHELSEEEIITKYSNFVKYLDSQLSLYKRALEIACYYMEYEYSKNNDDIYYRKERELEMIFLDKAETELRINKRRQNYGNKEEK